MLLIPSDLALVFTRAGRAVRKHGLGGMARLAVDHLRPRARVAADYVWYRIDLAEVDRSRPALEAGLRLRRGDMGDIGLLLQMPRDAGVTTMTEPIARRRLAADGTPWLVERDGRVLFSCWTFDRALPVYGERGARLPLPSGVVGLEDSVVLPECRGRGIASAAWSQIADRQAEEGHEAVVVKVDVRNHASRRVAEKAGFTAFARMRIVWRDWRTIVRVGQFDGRPMCDWMRAIERG